MFQFNRLYSTRMEFYHSKHKLQNSALISKLVIYEKNVEVAFTYDMNWHRGKINREKLDVNLQK